MVLSLRMTTLEQHCSSGSSLAETRDQSDGRPYSSQSYPVPSEIRPNYMFRGGGMIPPTTPPPPI